MGHIGHRNETNDTRKGRYKVIKKKEVRIQGEICDREQRGSSEIKEQNGMLRRYQRTGREDKATHATK